MRSSTIRPILLTLLFACNQTMFGQTVVQGDVSGTWTTAGSPYIIIASATVPSGQTLTIQPGVTVKIGLGLNLIIGGSLVAIGTATDSIYFTTTETPPAAGQWRQIIVNGLASLEYCIVQYGGSGNTYALSMATTTATLQVRNSTVRQNYSGLYLRGANGHTMNVTIQNQSQDGLGLANGALGSSCFISNNSSYGIYCSFDSAKIENCIITNNANGISVTGGRVRINKSTINENTGIGVRVFSPSTPTYLQMDSCTVGFNGWHGIAGWNSSSAWNMTLKRNVVFRNQGSGVNFAGSNSVIENNTVAYNVDGISNIYAASAVIRNNILVNNTSRGIHSAVSPPPTVKFNDVFGNTTNFSGFSTFYGDTTLGYRNKNGDKCDPFSNISFDPSFVNAGANDYHLLSTSRCRDAGDTLSQSDPDSTLADIGAFFFDRRSLSVQPNSGQPSQYLLLQNYPNPFNPSTTIEFGLPKSSRATLKVYNLLGKEVATLVDGNLPVGVHKAEWNPRAASSGVYFYRLEAGGYVETKRLLLLK